MDKVFDHNQKGRLLIIVSSEIIRTKRLLALPISVVDNRHGFHLWFKMNYFFQRLERIRIQR